MLAVELLKLWMEQSHRHHFPMCIQFQRTAHGKLLRRNSIASHWISRISIWRGIISISRNAITIHWQYIRNLKTITWKSMAFSVERECHRWLHPKGISCESNFDRIIRCRRAVLLPYFSLISTNVRSITVDVCTSAKIRLVRLCVRVTMDMCCMTTVWIAKKVDANMRSLLRMAPLWVQTIRTTIHGN